ncbi:MAG TPA: hypothetical protein VIL46_03420 [Gemmataceae bacterium]
MHEWLTRDLDAVVRAMRTTRVQLNSAALWWFCSQLSAKERAEILGEYVKFQALNNAEAEAQPEHAGDPAPRARRRKSSANGS